MYIKTRRENSTFYRQHKQYGRRSGLMVSVLDSGANGPGSSPGGDIVLCSCARHFTLTVPLSTQVYKWVPANLMLGGNPAMNYHPIQGGVEILLVASCYRNRDKLWWATLARMQTLPFYLFINNIRPFAHNHP